MVLFWRYVPRGRVSNTQASPLALPKVMVYILAGVLAVSSGWRSAVPVAAGAAAGMLYLSDIFRVQSWGVPAKLRRWAQTHIQPLIASTHPQQAATDRAARAAGMMPGRPGAAGRGQQAPARLSPPSHDPELAAALAASLAEHGQPGGPRRGRGAAGSPRQRAQAGLHDHSVSSDVSPRLEASEPYAPSAAAIARLVDMGFPEVQVRQALVAAQGDEERAINTLLS